MSNFMTLWNEVVVDLETRLEQHIWAMEAFCAMKSPRTLPSHLESYRPSPSQSITMPVWRPEADRNRKHGSTEFLIDITNNFPLGPLCGRELCATLRHQNSTRYLCRGRRADTDSITATKSNLLTEKWTESTGVKSSTRLPTDESCVL